MPAINPKPREAALTPLEREQVRLMSFPPACLDSANLVESLHLLLTMVAETSQTGDSVDRALLDELSSDRSDMMDGIRKQLLGEAAAASVREAEPAP